MEDLAAFVNSPHPFWTAFRSMGNTKSELSAWANKTPSNSYLGKSKRILISSALGRLFIFSYKLYKKHEFQEVKNNFPSYKHIYSMLSDNLSKEVYLSALMYRVTGIPYYLSKVEDDEFDQYFLEELSLQDGESVVDCGGFIGDTLYSFLMHNIIPSKYWVYEPCTDTFQVLLRRLPFVERVGVRIIPIKAGVSSKSEVLPLYANGIAAGNTFSVPRMPHHSSTSNVSVTTLDETIDDTCTFIKMDIEGFELEALQGASKLITEQHPKLAICIYHKCGDFRTIPQFIMQIGGYTRFYVRQYAIDTVFYACAEPADQA